jgi:hypothetical protein
MSPIVPDNKIKRPLLLLITSNNHVDNKEEDMYVHVNIFHVAWDLFIRKILENYQH